MRNQDHTPERWPAGEGPDDLELARQAGDAGGPVHEVDPDAIAQSGEELDSMQDEIERLNAEVEEWKSKSLRALADFQNYQRRALENEKEARRQGAISVISQLMPVLDNFDLALKQDPDAVSAQQMFQGVSMIRGQLLQSLGSIGLHIINPKPGEDFDPHRHEAVAHIPWPDVQPGTTAQSFQVGYTLGDRVLRPAKVAVARAPEHDAGA